MDAFRTFRGMIGIALVPPNAVIDSPDEAETGMHRKRIDGFPGLCNSPKDEGIAGG
jgi:hypothetical protein